MCDHTARVPCNSSPGRHAVSCCQLEVAGWAGQLEQHGSALMTTHWSCSIRCRCSATNYPTNHVEPLKNSMARDWPFLSQAGSALSCRVIAPMLCLLTRGQPHASVFDADTRRLTFPGRSWACQAVPNYSLYCPTGAQRLFKSTVSIFYISINCPYNIDSACDAQARTPHQTFNYRFAVPFSSLCIACTGCYMTTSLFLF